MRILTREEYEAKAARRFWKWVDKSGDCWLWTGHKSDNGYGFFSLKYPDEQKAITIRSHRYSWIMANGPLADGIEIDHSCHTTLCVRPDHLRAATRKQNAENRQGAVINSMSGVRGVHWDKSKQAWRGRVGHNGKQFSVGLYDSIDKAAAAVREKQIQLYTHHPRGSLLEQQARQREHALKILSDDAFDAAAKAIYDRHGGIDWTNETDMIRAMFLRDAKEALIAAVPFISSDATSHS